MGPKDPLTLGSYFGLVLAYPLDFLAIYTRHLFNGLDIIYDTVYITDIYDRNLVLQILNYTLWFIALAFAARRASWKSLKWDSRLFIPVILSLSAIFSIPTMVEVRYMLPLHFMLYALMALWVLPDFVALERNRQVALIRSHILWYIAFLMVCFLLSANTYIGAGIRDVPCKAAIVS